MLALRKISAKTLRSRETQFVHLRREEKLPIIRAVYDKDPWPLGIVLEVVVHQFEDVSLRVVASGDFAQHRNVAVGLSKPIFGAGMNPKHGYVLVLLFYPVGKADRYLGLTVSHISVVVLVNQVTGITYPIPPRPYSESLLHAR